jgi:protein-disulfide isomerase
MTYFTNTVFSRAWLIAGCALLLASSDASAQANDKQFADQMKKFLASAEGEVALGKTVESYFQKRQQEAMKEEEDRARNEVENQFKNPVKIDLGSAPVKGPANAKVTIVEFSDFQCPFCRRGNDTVAQVLKMYPNDVKVAFKHKPLPMHPEAEPAARATWAAQKQGKFWEMNDMLFGNQDKLASAFYEEAAKKIGLNVEQFKKDMASPEAAAAVKADAEQGDKLGVQGTPNFFINGVALRGAYPADQFKTIIDRWLKGGK